MDMILNSLGWRYATKQFDTEKKLSEDQLNTIKEALRMTPSSFGLQPWKFVFVKNPKTREKLKEHAWGQTQITDASHLLVLCRVNEVDQDLVNSYFEDMKKTTGAGEDDIKGYKDMVSGFAGNLDETSAKIWAEKQVYIALGNIMTVLAEMKIDSCPMEGFDAAKFDEILGLHEKGISSTVVLPIGFRSEDDSYAGNPKVRFETEELFIEM
ncbi:NAD(P)H-dependent oxidoreductase [Candidatus Gracilibacteria bacterium]|nr:NAD(P)H-dependent oxidoreductase [Candidatus Gracilibacteria bacterium]